MTLIDGHFALLPVAIYHGTDLLRSRDPIPMNGQKCRSDVIDSLKSLAAALQVPPQDWSTLVPAHLMSGDGALLKHTRALVHDLCTVTYIPIVEKHVSALWGFCRQGA